MYKEKPGRRAESDIVVAFLHTVLRAHASKRCAPESRISVARRAPPLGSVYPVLLDPVEHNDLNDIANRVAA